jgi:hypothetical protein
VLEFWDLYEAVGGFLHGRVYGGVGFAAS